MGGDDGAVCFPEDVVGPQPVRDTDRHHVVGGDELPGQRHDLADLRTGGQAVADCLEHFLAAEGRDLGRQPVGRGQSGEEFLRRRRARLRDQRRTDPPAQVSEGVVVEPERPGPFPPLRHQTLGLNAAVLRLAGGIRRHLGRPGRRLAPLGHVGLDLHPPAGERPQRPLRDPGNVGDPPADRGPLDPETTGQLLSELRLVQIADRLRPSIERAGVECRPPLVLRREHQIRNKDVRVEMRIPGTRSPVAERRRHEPLGHHPLRPTLPPPGPGGETLQRPHRRPDRCVVGIPHLVRHLRAPESEEQRDRLRSAERSVEPRDLRRPLRPGQPCPGFRVTVIQDTVQDLAVNLSRQAEPLRAPAHPHARSFLGVGVVLLQPVGHLRQVVVGIPELPDRQHADPASPLRFPFSAERSPAPLPETLTGPRRTPGASASG